MTTFAGAERREIEEQTGASVAVGMSVFAWVAFWAAMARPALSPLWAAGCAVVAVIGVWLWYHAGRHPKEVITAELVAAFVAAGAAYGATGALLAGAFFLVPLTLGAILLTLRQTVALVAATAAFLYLASPGVQGGDRLAPLALVGAVLIFQIPALAFLKESLSRSWQYSAHTVDLADEARQHRGEVARLNKALNLAYSLLERRYEQLAVARYEAEQARHLKEQFATNVSHELRTPLNIILGFLEILQRYPEVYGDVHWTPKLRSDLAEIRHSARYLSDLVDDILDLARIEAMKMPLHREPADPEEVIREAADLACRLLHDKPVKMTVIVPERLPPLFIDRTRIRQVLLNLLANASRFTERGQIAVRAELRNKEVVVAVSDTGPGIPADRLSNLFSEFEQVTTQKGTDKGKGLGLVIAKGFVEMHGGAIWVESQVGEGSTFYFSLPVEPKSVALPGHADVRKPVATGLPLLVAVGPDSGAGYLRRRLEGHEVLVAPDLTQVRTIVDEQRPDAVLLATPPEHDEDTQGQPPPILPEGITLIQCSLPVSTWLIDHELFDDWLVKPVGRGHLIETIGRFCEAGELLFVDDDPGFIQLIRRVMQTDTGRYRLRWAYSTEEALARMKEQTPDLLLVDIALPDRDGSSLAQAVRHEPATMRLPIIALSASPPWSGVVQGRASTFSVTRRGGLGEEELLGLIRYTLDHIKPRYVAARHAEALPPDPAGLPAS